LLPGGVCEMAVLVVEGTIVVVGLRVMALSLPRRNGCLVCVFYCPRVIQFCVTACGVFWFWGDVMVVGLWCWFWVRSRETV